MSSPLSTPGTQIKLPIHLSGQGVAQFTPILPEPIWLLGVYLSSDSIAPAIIMTMAPPSLEDI